MLPVGTVHALSDAPMRDPEIGDRIDQYQLTGLLARGGMASIFEAVDSESRAVVVLKIPYFQYESDLIYFERFRREEEIGERLDHPGIVKVLKPREKSRVYLAMEYVPGQPLRSLLRSQQPLPAAQDRPPALGGPAYAGTAPRQDEGRAYAAQRTLPRFRSRAGSDSPQGHRSPTAGPICGRR
jgi:hypothetical protein